MASTIATHMMTTDNAVAVCDKDQVHVRIIELYTLCEVLVCMWEGKINRIRCHVMDVRNLRVCANDHDVGGAYQCI